MLWRFLVLVVLALAMAGAAACGDDDDAGDDGGATATAPAASETEPPDGTGEPTDTPDGTDEPTETDEPDGGGDGAIQLEAADFSFSTDTISAPAGSEVTIEFSNTGDAFHTFTVDELNISEQLDGGESTTITFTMPDSETPFYCAFHQSVMTGTLQPADESAQSGGGGNDEASGGRSGGYIY
jgi:plastocyanin